MIKGLIDRTGAVVGALVFSQIPEFIHQYQLILKGHVDELNFQYQKLLTLASNAGKSLPDYINKFIDFSDKDIHSQGVWMQEIIARHDSFSSQLYRLQEALPFFKPLVFLPNVNGQIWSSTWDSFTPGISFSSEGIIYIVVGAVVGSLIATIAGLPLRLIGCK